MNLDQRYCSTTTSSFSCFYSDYKYKNSTLFVSCVQTNECTFSTEYDGACTKCKTYLISRGHTLKAWDTDTTQEGSECNLSQSTCLEY